MVPAIAKLPVNNHEIRRVSAEARILHVIVFSAVYLCECISPDQQRQRGLVFLLARLDP